MSDSEEALNEIFDGYDGEDVEEDIKVIEDIIIDEDVAEDIEVDIKNTLTERENKNE